MREEEERDMGEKRRGRTDSPVASWPPSCLLLPVLLSYLLLPVLPVLLLLSCYCLLLPVLLSYLLLPIPLSYLPQHGHCPLTEGQWASKQAKQEVTTGGKPSSPDDRLLHALLQGGPGEGGER